MNYEESNISTNQHKGIFFLEYVEANVNKSFKETKQALKCCEDFIF